MGGFSTIGGGITLTKRFGIIERVSPSFTSTTSVPYRARRFLPSSVRIILYASSSTAQVVVEEDDILSRAQIVAINPGMVNEANLRDHDDGTYAYMSVSISPGSEVEAVTYDLGAQYNGYLFYLFSSSQADLAKRLYVSSNCASWTRILNTTSTGTLSYAFKLDSLRCVSIAIANVGTSTLTLNPLMWSGYSFEFYPLTGKRVITGNDTVKTMCVFIDTGYYQLLEVYEV